jgi:hypothetical protein
VKFRKMLPLLSCCGEVSPQSPANVYCAHDVLSGPRLCSSSSTSASGDTCDVLLSEQKMPHMLVGMVIYLLEKLAKVHLSPSCSDLESILELWWHVHAHGSRQLEMHLSFLSQQIIHSIHGQVNF